MLAKLLQTLWALNYPISSSIIIAHVKYRVHKLCIIALHGSTELHNRYSINLDEVKGRDKFCNIDLEPKFSNTAITGASKQQWA